MQPGKFAGRTACRLGHETDERAWMRTLSRICLHFIHSLVQWFNSFPLCNFKKFEEINTICYHNHTHYYFDYSLILLLNVSLFWKFGTFTQEGWHTVWNKVRTPSCFSVSSKRCCSSQHRKNTELVSGKTGPTYKCLLKSTPPKFQLLWWNQKMR